MVERKAFLVKLKRQYRVPECGKHNRGALEQKNGDYYEYPSLSHFTDEC